MDAIKTYLDTPPANQLYSVGFKLFTQHRVGRWPKVFEKLSLGPLGRNKDELLTYLRKILDEPPPNPPLIVYNPSKAAVEPQNSSPAKESVSLGSLEKKLRGLYQQRAKTSQSFHDCNSNESRALVCDQIEIINTQIKEAVANIEYFKIHGRLKLAETPVEFALPDNDTQLAKRQRQIRSNILKVENRLSFLMDLPTKDRRRKKIPEKETQLRELYSEVEAIVAKRNELKRDVSKKDV